MIVEKTLRRNVPKRLLLSALAELENEPIVVLDAFVFIQVVKNNVAFIAACTEESNIF